GRRICSGGWPGPSCAERKSQRGQNAADYGGLRPTHQGSSGAFRRISMTGLFIRRPIMTSLVMLAILVFGIFAYRTLPVSDLPNVDFPTIQVNASLPGASPETMASSVATPLEKQFTTIAGISQMTSTSQLGSTSITIQFD